jgi:hypothetical protein
MLMNRREYLEIINRLELEAFQLNLEGWLKNELFTWEWWILVVFLISPWILWVKLAKGTKIMETILFGSLVIIPTTYPDALVIALEFWRYPVKLLPFTPRAIPFDMSMVPVAFMLLYQYFGTWTSFCVSLVIMSLVYAFIGEPLSTWLGLVNYVNWKYE